MLTNIVEGLEEGVPKPTVVIDQEIMCGEVNEFFGILLQDDFSEHWKIDIFDSLLYATAKYNEYIAKSNINYDPVELDQLKHQYRQLVKLKGIVIDGRCNTFTIVKAYFSNREERNDLYELVIGADDILAKQELDDNY